jgi:hypothetical protein
MTREPSKAEKRELRKAEKREAQKDAQVKFPSTANEASSKTLKRVAPIPDLSQKVFRSQEKPRREKFVYLPTEDKFSNDCVLTWCASRFDSEGEWSWKEQRQCSETEWEEQINPNFKNLEELTWREIQFDLKVPAKGGKSVPRHHSQEVCTLITEAQDRWMERGLEEYDSAFRFRFGNKIRAWGIKLEGHFYLIWWERNHKIYPVSRS